MPQFVSRKGKIGQDWWDVEEIWRAKHTKEDGVNKKPKLTMFLQNGQSIEVTDEAEITAWLAFLNETTHVIVDKNV